MLHAQLFRVYLRLMSFACTGANGFLILYPARSDLNNILPGSDEKTDAYQQTDTGGLQVDTFRLPVSWGVVDEFRLWRGVLKGLKQVELIAPSIRGSADKAFD